MDNSHILCYSFVYDDIYLHAHLKVLERTGYRGSLSGYEISLYINRNGQYDIRLSDYLTAAADHLETTDEFQGTRWCFSDFLDGTFVSEYMKGFFSSSC